MPFSSEISSPPCRLSIDAILKRTRPGEKPANNLIPFAEEEDVPLTEPPETAEDLMVLEKRLFRRRAEITERERVVNESELLLSARERLLDNREQLLAERMSAFTKDGDTEWLQKTLAETREALTMANDSLAEKEAMLEQLRAEIGELKKNPPASPPESPVKGEEDDSYAGVRDPSLSEQVALLKEREAFIEESENTLFNKAQELQEWETRLQQAQDTA